MKRGFTLIELLAVIVILGLLSLIVVPVVTNLVKQNKDDLYNTQVGYIEEAARNWAADNVFSLPSETGDTPTNKTIQDLEEGGYLEVDIKNPKTGELFNKSDYVTIMKTNHGYEYEYHEAI